MARALLGYVGSSSEQVLLLEVARLRRRVAELEAELSEVRAEQRVAIDLELHQLAHPSEHHALA
jgi:hypothetical protein